MSFQNDTVWRFFLTFFEMKNHFYDSLICITENGAPATDTVSPAGLIVRLQYCAKDLGWREEIL